MKLVTFKYQGKETVGVLDLKGEKVYTLETFGLTYKSMNEWIREGKDEEWEIVRSGLSQGLQGGIWLHDVELLAPIPRPRQDIICLGINYLAHAEESARYKKEAFGGERPFAVYFSKRVREAVKDGGFIPSYEGLVDSLDYEVELAVILGKDAQGVSKEEAFNYVLGYTILNDVSARNLQTQHKQWYFGKSLEGFCPMGPWIVTKEDLPIPPKLPISSRVNGELRQNATTDLLIFDIAHVISELSQGMLLEAGTIIAMGTPAGVGMGFDPPKFLKAGDIIECEIQGIGKLTNQVR